MSKSQIFGNVDATTLTGSLDWTLVFHNSTDRDQEARGEIALPRGAIVSRVTLWVNGQPQEGAFANTEQTENAYKWIVRQNRDPVLVTSSGTDRIMVQCSPVPANRGEIKVRLGLKVPLSAENAYKCSIELPKFMEANFGQPKRHRVHLVANEILSSSSFEPARITDAKEFVLDGIVKGTNSEREDGRITLERKAPLTAIATPDWYSHNKRYIIERFQEVSSYSPKRLFVVVDPSASLKSVASEIKESLASIPGNLNPQIYFAYDNNSISTEADDIKSKPLGEAQSAFVPESFVGGQDNGPTLKEALENTAEKSGGAVLWIHGPQPIAEIGSEAGPPDLIHGVHLYDFEVQPGRNALYQSLGLDRLGSLVSYSSVRRSSTVANDMKELFASWQKTNKELVAIRTVSDNPSGLPVVSNRMISSQVTSLWAKEQVEKLLAEGQKEQAIAIASHYRVVTPLTGAVVMEYASDYQAQQLDPGNFKDSSGSAGAPGAQFMIDSHRHVSLGGLVGAPVTPRYGQSNEVGMIADYGYDTARDVVRVLTFAAAAICLLRTILFVKNAKKKPVKGLDKAKFIALMVAVPIVVHLLGTFFINNFGGLGGGL